MNAAPAVYSARLSIPTEFESSDAYHTRIGQLFVQGNTHIYVDTSFLMWATKIGPVSRAELLGWLRQDLADRVHIPTWAAHEYLRHHVAGTIVDELTKKSAEVSQLAGSVFGYFRPFLDDPALSEGQGWDRLRASTRDAINTFGRLTQAAKDWRQAYPSHAEQIIDYINERVMTVETLFEDLSSIVERGAARYEGRIPPGYQDRNKKGQEVDDPDESSVSGANRYGDLIFWKEALRHAASAGATAIVILTNDRKNDWRMGGDLRAKIDPAMLSLKKSWHPVPRIHPMLALEAKVAGIDEVALIDSQYLAAYLRVAAPERVNAFADVAIVPDPASQSQDDERAEVLRRRLAADAEQSARESGEAVQRAIDDGFRFPDDPAVRTTKSALTKALLLSREQLDERWSALLLRARSDADSSEALDTILTQENLAGMDHVALVGLARSLHDRVLAGEPGYNEALVDLVGLLHELPSATAGAILLGLLGSMYLEHGTGSSRLPPKSPVSELLWTILDRPFADMAAQVISDRLARNDRAPLFKPTDEKIEMLFDVDPEAVEADVLRSIRVDGIEILTAAQDDPSLRLGELLQSDVAPAQAIAEVAAGLFALRMDRLQIDDRHADFRLNETIGFKSPDQVSRLKEEE